VCLNAVNLLKGDHVKRKEALLQGLVTYYTGKPCKNGHDSPKRAINGSCTACEKVKNNSEGRQEYMSAYAEKERSRVRAIASKWQQNNKGKVNANTACRHTAKMQRQPSWLTKEDKQYIRCLYQLSAMRSRESGIEWNVDHVVPLQGENVSGLHVPWNLQVIPASDNFKKNNKWQI
jgi:hypothetical protein